MTKGDFDGTASYKQVCSPIVGLLLDWPAGIGWPQVGPCVRLGDTGVDCCCGPMSIGANR